MLTFMDYVVYSFGDATKWNRDNTYSSLTATTDAILDFPTPQHIRLNVSSLASPQFATSYSLGTVGQLDGSISYLYTTLPLRIPSQTPSIPLRTLVTGYRQLGLPLPPASYPRWQHPLERKDTLLHATLHLPAPSRLHALYLRRVSPKTLVSVSLNSLQGTPSPSTNAPPASLLAHVSHDAGKYSIEGLASTDNALLGLRGLWNFGSDLSSKHSETQEAIPDHAQEASDLLSEGLTDLPPRSSSPTLTRPSLLSAGAEFYYSPLSSVIGLSTGLRFTTLSPSHSPSEVQPIPAKPLAGTSSAISSQLPSNIAAGSSFPYTLTLTLTPLTGSLASTYSVRATPTISLSSRFGFNVYSWESEYVLGAEVWRKRARAPRNISSRDDDGDLDGLNWARKKAADWYEESKQRIANTTTTTSSLGSSPTSATTSEPTRLLDTSNPPPNPPDKIDESVIHLRVDDRWNFRALWTGRVKELLISAGFTIGPTSPGWNSGAGVGRGEFVLGGGGGASGTGTGGRLRGSFGVEVVYSS